MKTRWSDSGLGVALTLGWSVLFLTAPARAQDEPFSGDLSAGTEASGGVEAQAETQTEETPAPAEETPAPAEEPAKAEAKAEVTAPAAAEPPSSEPASDAEREQAVSKVGVELLPGSAYPEPYVRGIKFGSLWLTMQGHQWPYMPMISGEPALRVGLSGSMWNDLSYARIDSGLKPNTPDQHRLITETRGVLRVTPTYSTEEDWFVQGNGEFVIHGDMNVPNPPNLASTDDLFVRAGKWDLFDVTFGRFQGWEIGNHYGMGLDINTLERQGARIQSQQFRPPDGYGLTYFWDRSDFQMGAYAVHVYPVKFLRAEVLGHLGAGNATGSGPWQQADIRPSAIIDLGIIKVKGGVEFGKSTPQNPDSKWRNRRSGYSGAVQLVLAPWVEVGGSFGMGFEDVLNQDGLRNDNQSNTVWSYGGFLNLNPTGGKLPLVIGGGVFNHHWEDLRHDPSHNDRVDTDDQLLAFGAIQYTFWDKLYLKVVGAHAKYEHYDYSSTPFTNKMNSLRLRAMVLF